MTRKDAEKIVRGYKDLDLDRLPLNQRRIAFKYRVIEEIKALEEECGLGTLSPKQLQNVFTSLFKGTDLENIVSVEIRAETRAGDIHFCKASCRVFNTGLETDDVRIVVAIYPFAHR